MSCVIVEDRIRGWQALRLSNALIEVTVLPEKGADIYSFIDRRSGVDVLMKTPWGLQAPGSPPRAGSEKDRFLHNYEGAWQELFPNTGPPCRHDGQDLPLHGEAAIQPWNVQIEREDRDRICVRLELHCRQLPLSLTRRMLLEAGMPTLTLAETVRNLSSRRVSFTWGHHPVLGKPFLEEGCRVNVDPCMAHTPDPPYDPPSSCYLPGQRAPWPHIRGIDGGEIDLRQVPGPEERIHDHAFLSELRRGRIEVENPRLGLAFELAWDAGIFKWINNWRPLGGVSIPSLQGIYGLAVEPWVTRSNVADAIAAGEALSLDGGGVLETSLRATLRHVGGSKTP